MATRSRVSEGRRPTARRVGSFLLALGVGLSVGLVIYVVDGLAELAERQIASVFVMKPEPKPLALAAAPRREASGVAEAVPTVPLATGTAFVAYAGATPRATAARSQGQQPATTKGEPGQPPAAAQSRGDGDPTRETDAEPEKAKAEKPEKAKRGDDDEASAELPESSAGRITDEDKPDRATKPRRAKRAPDD